MGALERMAVTKGAVLALLQRSYQERHVVALTTFGGGGAKTTLAPTKSVLLAKKPLTRSGLTAVLPLPPVSRLVASSFLQQADATPVCVKS